MVHRVPSTFTLLDKKEHAWKRRILSQGFSESAIRSFEPQLLTQIAKFCSVVCPEGGKALPLCVGDAQRPWSAPVDMSTWCKFPYVLIPELQNLTT
jgi:cytochrome P450